MATGCIKFQQAVGSCGDVHSHHSLREDDDEDAESTSSTEATSSGREEYRTVDTTNPLGNRHTSAGKKKSTSSASETEGSSTSSSSSSSRSSEDGSSESATSESYTTSSSDSESIDHDIANRSTNNDEKSVKSSSDRDQLASPTARGSNRHRTDKDTGGNEEPIDKVQRDIQTFDQPSLECGERPVINRSNRKSVSRLSKSSVWHWLISG